MQFVYDLNASKEQLQIKDENYRYLFKVKRLKVGDIVNFRNLEDGCLYCYAIKEIGKKEAILKLTDSIKDNKQNFKTFHLLLCIIDTKVIYATLPMLNQLGVTKISFIYCDRSQKNFKVDLQKVQKILVNSCQQSGRSQLMDIEVLNSLDEIRKEDSDFLVLDFGGEKEWGDIKTVLIGPEGGFSENERQRLADNYKIGLTTDFILKSETAALAIVSKALI